MYNEEEYNNRVSVLTKIISLLERKLPQCPKGHIRIFRDRKYIKCYLLEKRGDTIGRYLKKSEINLAKGIVKREYYDKLLKESKREKRAIERFVKEMRGTRPEEVFDNLGELKKELVEPLLLSDEEYAKYWESLPYKKNPYHPEECIHQTDKGDLVRSKSEARVADMYFALGIPYRYEAELKLKNGKSKYPDFTLLKLPERTEYYHEHMGLMEDDMYRENNLIKLNEYAESNIFTGINLILSFETTSVPLSIKALKNNVKAIFLN